MKKLFSPDYFFEYALDITPDFLKELGISTVVLDIDNTLVTYGEPYPTEDVKKWVGKIKSSGISVAIASNNRGDRVTRFNEALGTFAVCNSGKPSRRAVRIVCGHFSVKPEDVALIGDQIFTDMLCANRSGAKSILVKPLPYNENLFFRFKRLCEKPIINRFKKNHREKCFEKGV